MIKKVEKKKKHLCNMKLCLSFFLFFLTKETKELYLHVPLETTLHYIKTLNLTTWS